MSEQARTWALRLLALGIAIGIWFNASVEDRLVPSERVVEASVSYNRPRGYMVIDPVGTVSVRLLGNKKAIRQLSPFEVNVTVDLTPRQEGTTAIILGPENVGVPDGLEVSSIEPGTIQVTLEREVTQRLPVVPKLSGRPAKGITVEEPEVFPNQVLVTGPASRLARVESLSTVAISLNGRASTFEETVAVKQPDPLIQIVQPSQVTVRVPLQPPAQERQATDSKPRKEES